ncbi:hypothetical protein AX15_001366 [Amanita polypyramis BW_CC]|nr:hypothetical protein AX15_001366 [Amanita polypyramis BW_CC]
MQSLRSLHYRRSQNRKPPSKPTKNAAQPVPRESRVKSRVDDKIKKRMSMRYADISSPTELSPGLPPVPAISQSFAIDSPVDGPSLGGASFETESEDAARSRTAKEDKKFLDAENFDPDAFLKLKLANSTEAELQSLQSSLHAAKEATAADLQRTVFKNYAEFVLISKEISSLENELLELKDLLSDYKSMPSLLHIPDPTTLTSSTLSTYKRSSVADLRIMYYNQMQSLHSTIEGASKFAPITPGRHVVSEMEGIYSLNAATYRVAGKVKFVILDDAVLVARRRRRNVGNDGGGKGGPVNEGKLVAERCWPLNEILVLDTKDSSSMTNVFKIRHGKEAHVYRTENSTDKRALLVQLRQVAEELAARRRREREGEHERRKTLFHSSNGDRTVPPMPEWMADLARKGGDIPGAGADAKEKAERDARWTSDWADQLTVAIALREWIKAVELVEKAQERLAVTPTLESKLPVLRSQLIAALLDALSKPTIRRSSVVILISLLTRLKAGSAARNTLLQMRSQVIKSHIRNIRFEGNISTYIADLAIVCFTGIKHTADWFLASFKENEAASSFVDWTKKEIENYAEIFRKQVFTPDVDPGVVREAVKITHAQGRKLLQEYGLDFTHIFNELLVENPKEPLKLESTFSFNSHNPLSKHPSQVFSPATTPKQATSTNGQRTPPVQGAASSSSEAPPVPALPSYLKQQPSKPAMQASKSTDRDPDRAPTPQSSKPSMDRERVPTPKLTDPPDLSPVSITEPSLTFPLMSPTSPYSPTTFPYSGATATPTSATSFAMLGNMLSPTAATNDRMVFSIPSRSGARTPVSSREPLAALSGMKAPAYVSPLSSPVPQSLKSPVKKASSSSLSGTRIGNGSSASVNEMNGASGTPGRVPPRALRAGMSNAPPTPARSSNRPGAGHRPPPVAVPQHDGMI